MRKFLLFFLLLTTATFAQTIKELEYDLYHYSSTDTDTDLYLKARKLQLIDPFNFIATERICRYYEKQKTDSVSIYFENLISTHPNNPEPFLLRSDLLIYELPYDRDSFNKLKVNYLNKALKIAPKNKKIIYELLKVYYLDFIFPFEVKQEDVIFETDEEKDKAETKEEPQKKSTFENSAQQALSYIYQIWGSDVEKKEIIYYPMKQLECFLNINESTAAKKEEGNFKSCHFPLSYFANLKTEWECDFTRNYLFEMESETRALQWLNEQLEDLDEECLFTKKVSSQTMIYRFTWLRTFHNPIVITIENNNGKIMLYWKIGEGQGGYKPKGLKESGSRKISSGEWLEFEQLVELSDFENLPHKSSVLMMDGSIWMLERKSKNSFKAHNTNWPFSEYKEACLYLLKLTEIKIEKRALY